MDKEHKFHFSAMGSSYELTDSTEFDKKGFDYIWYGPHNLYPQQTIDLYQNSATHNALVNSISGWIYGGGIDADNKLEKPEEWAKFSHLISQKIGKNDIQLMCMDLKLHGGFYISLTYSMDRESLSEINVLPFETMRSGHANDDGEIEYYYYSQNWQDQRRANITTIKAFNPDEKIAFPTQVLFVKMNSVGSYYYPKPDYIGAWNYIELDKNVSQYHLSQIEKGLAPSYIINFANGIPPREKREDIKNQIERELAGSQNAGKFLCTFSDGRDTTPEITPVPLSEASNQYQFLSEEITKKVMISHRVVSPRLFGVIDSSGLGNNAEELQTASALFEQTVIEPFRKVIIDALNLVMMEDGINLSLYFKPFDLFKTEFADTEAETKNEETALNDCGCKEEFISPNPCEDGYEAIGHKIKNGRKVPNCVPIKAEKLSKVGTIITDGIELPLYETIEEAEKEAERLGGSGYHEHTIDGNVFYMPFQDHDEAKKLLDSSVQELSDEKAELLIEQLSQYAQYNDEKEWGLISEEWVDTTKSNFHEFKTLKDIDKKPSKGMVEEAKKGLKWRKEYGRGGTAVGVARARDIANGKNLSISTIKRMYSFFSRHEKATKRGKGFKIGEDGFPSAGRIAWALWGGDAGFSWSKKKVAEIENVKEGLHKFDKMPSKSMADADDKSKWGDTGLYKVRYVYEHTAGKKAKDSSRLFCRKMMEFTRQGVEWRYEDIIQMGRDGVNGDLAEKGKSTYNIFLYKGGANCYHGWIRRIYLRKRDASGKFLPNKGMDNEKRVGNNPYVKQKGSESIAPINTPSRGYVNKP